MRDQQQNGNNDNTPTEPFVRNSALRASVRSTSSHVHPHHHSHHNHRRRKRGASNNGISNGSAAADVESGTQLSQHHHEVAGTQHSVSRQTHTTHACTRRHRSVTDLSNASLNTCNDPTCTDREVQEIFVHKSSATCCSGSRPELAQYFAEDLYGSSSRRPSSCCTSSDYCYQTDSTSLYGSRSSLSRNNSVKSASVTLRKKKISQQRQPSYHSISLRALNDSRPGSNMGSLASIFDRAKQYAENGEKLHGSASKVTIERQTSKDALSNDLPEYACSPSPIRWSFLADGKPSAKDTTTATARKKKISQQRQPSYHSISLRALNDSRPGSNMGSLASIFDRAKQYAENGEKLHGSASKVTIERQTSKDALSNDLPEYACSPSPIRWSFLADGKPSAKDTTTATATATPVTSTINSSSIAAHRASSSAKAKEAEQHSSKRQTSRQHHHHQPPSQHPQQPRKPERAHKPEARASEHPQKPPRSHSQHRKSIPSAEERPSTSSSRKCCESPCKYEESTMVQFHQDAEAFNNCCSNYIQCNTYLDQDLQITSEDIHHYLAKGQQDVGNILNNTKTYPFQPSNALEFQYKNNFANNNTATNTLSSVEGAESMRSYDSRFRRNSSKETNLNQNSGSETCSGAAGGAGGGGSCSASANINLSSSTNNINIVFSSSTERNANEVKFINTTSRSGTSVVSSEAHHSSYLPYSYPTYDYTNMSTNSTFDKTLGIDEIPASGHRGDDGTAGTTSSSQHSSSLHSPEPQRVSFESFDAASGHNLISSHRGSCQYSPTTPRSPLSPGSPGASSTYSASINPSTTSYVHLQQHHPHYDYPPGIQRSHVHAHTHAHAHSHHLHDHHLRESFKISNALRKVRKRARKYTDFLRKK
uniref:Uncharacterized protein n=1 Tax=Stomoxys calcitrans TaxID=35570 RepID=A0A1I8P0H4_STOCA